MYTTEMVKSKACHDCKEVKPTAMFGSDKKTKDGLNYLCVLCQNKQARESYHRVKNNDGVKNLSSGKKLCVSCSQTKSLFDFPRHNQSADGRQYKCFDCVDAQKAESDKRAAKRAKRQDYHRAYREKNKDLIRAKVRAKRIAHQQADSAINTASTSSAWEAITKSLLSEPPVKHLVSPEEGREAIAKLVATRLARGEDLSTVLAREVMAIEALVKRVCVVNKQAA